MLKRLKKLKKRKQTVILRKQRGIGIKGILVHVDKVGVTIKYEDPSGTTRKISFPHGTYESIE